MICTQSCKTTCAHIHCDNTCNNIIHCCTCISCALLLFVYTQEYEAKLEELESALLKQLQTDTAVEKLEEQRKVYYSYIVIVVADYDCCVQLRLMHPARGHRVTTCRYMTLYKVIMHQTSNNRRTGMCVVRILCIFPLPFIRNSWQSQKSLRQRWHRNTWRYITPAIFEPKPIG